MAEGTEVGLITIVGSPAVERFAEIVQQAWSDVGVELRIVPSQNITEDFYQNVREPLFILPTSRGGVSKVTNQYVGPQLGNVCRWDDPELAALTTELASTAADDPKAVQLWAQVQQIVFDDAVSIFGLFNPIIWAFDESKLGGVAVGTATIQFPYFFSIFVKP